MHLGVLFEALNDSYQVCFNHCAKLAIRFGKAATQDVANYVVLFAQLHKSFSAEDHPPSFP